MLHEFISAHRSDLIRRCRGEAARRAPAAASQPELDHGVPLFLDQLVATLRHERDTVEPAQGDTARRAAEAESSRTAALHGGTLQEMGFSVEEVVHAYGDVCQAITKLASELHVPVTVEEFQTLNRLLDNAIADAVTSYGRKREGASARGETELHRRMETLAQEERRLVDTALKALDAVKVGNIGLMGATGTLIEDNLVRLRDLIDRSLPETPLAGRKAARMQVD